MRPKRSLSQNFLVDPNLQRKVVDALGIEPGDEVLEIGPGRGALTRHLVEVADTLVLVELDDALARELGEEYGDRPGVAVVHADVLEVDPADHVRDPGGLKVVGNIPYHVTTPILFHLLERPRPAEIVIMVQKEVGERIVAGAGSSAYGALAVGVRSVAEAELLFDVSRQAFRPVPGVDSTVVRIRPFDPPPLSPERERSLRALTRAAFQWRRKQFQTTLRKHPRYELSHDEVAALEEATGYELRRRPETFSPDGFVTLADGLTEMGRPLGGDGA